MVLILRKLWRLVQIAVVIFGLLLTFIAVIEITGAFFTLRNINVILGYAFIGLVLLCLACPIAYGLKILYSFPPTLKPPALESLDGLTVREAKKYCHYLLAFMKRLEINDHIGMDQKRELSRGISLIQEAIEGQESITGLTGAIEQVEEEIIKPTLGELDQQAKLHVTHSIRDIMLGVVLSPYRSSDILIVIFRNFKMALNIVKIYNNRPSITETLLIFRDILNVVASINYLNIVGKIFEDLLKDVPFVGRVTDEIAQAVGAGLMTSVAGDAALRRCNSFRGWSYDESKVQIEGQLSTYLGYVKEIVEKDILPRIPGVQKLGQLKNNISDAFDSLTKKIKIGAAQDSADEIAKTTKQIEAEMIQIKDCLGDEYELSHDEGCLLTSCILYLIQTQIDNTKNSKRKQQLEEILAQHNNSLAGDEEVKKMIVEQAGDETVLSLRLRAVDSAVKRRLLAIELLSWHHNAVKQYKFDRKLNEKTVYKLLGYLDFDMVMTKKIDQLFRKVMQPLNALKITSIIIAGAAMGGAGGLIAAPAIGAFLGTTLFGLSGAAAVSSGLAFLGGGALATGAFGMAGGTAVITTIGALTGGGISTLFNTTSRQSIATEITKLQITFLTIILEQQNDTTLANEVLRIQRIIFNKLKDEREYLKSQIKTKENKAAVKEANQIIKIFEKAITWEEAKLKRFNLNTTSKKAS